MWRGKLNKDIQTKQKNLVELGFEYGHDNVQPLIYRAIIPDCYTSVGIYRQIKVV